ncbi:MAG: GDYXXLXY domain-containing protein [Burkholderiales bacterium]|nr:GDYXXLXY domain-containing protein [Burkholderiales bacterium]
MSKRTLIGLILVIAAQVLWVVATTVIKEDAHATGRRILLETRPVDPRDLLRGDYLILNYNISTIPRDMLRGAVPEIVLGKTIYVSLVPAGRFYRVEYASFQPIASPNANSAAVVVRGTVDERFRWMRGNADADSKAVPVMYGIERYYVPEGEGNPKGTLTVEASITGSGEALIRELLVDGKPFAQRVR